MNASGFIDLQVNGYAGVDFTSYSLTPEGVRAVAQSLYREGTLAFLPTVITAAWEVYEHVLPLLARVIEAQPAGSRLLGIHLEGPYISAEDGARGVHPRLYVRLPSIKELERMYVLAGGQLRLLTLAPELPGAIELTKAAVDLGITVSIGHTLADSAAIQAAVEAGAKASTHLGNGCPVSLHRHHNPLWPQLSQPGLTAMLITDGHHLPPDFIRTVVLAKGISKVVVTSDAAPAAGLPAGEYQFFGSRVRLEPDGRLHSPQTGTLAGSSATMRSCLNWLRRLGILDEAGLWAVGRDNPLQLLGLIGTEIPAGQVYFTEEQFIVER
jgi:N-acetylglucosamine-6-phosphate deacetylase